MKTLTGIIHGRTIELSTATDIADGVEVEVVIRASRAKRVPGEGFLRTEGALASDPDWDAIMEEVHGLRH